MAFNWNNQNQIHTLKILPRYFSEVITGTKTFEIRAEDNRKFNVGDDVIFKEFDEKTGTLTGGTKIAKITYVLRNVPEYGLKDGYCIFSFKI